jgi:hypothetical protein
MSKTEMKLEIVKLLDQFSDESLAKLFSFLKDVEKTKHNSFANPAILEKILQEDKGLLERLAQ